MRDAKPIIIPETNSEPEPDLAIVELNRALYCTRHPYPENIFWLIEVTLSDGEVSPLIFPDIKVSVRRLLEG